MLFDIVVEARKRGKGFVTEKSGRNEPVYGWQVNDAVTCSSTTAGPQGWSEKKRTGCRCWGERENREGKVAGFVVTGFRVCLIFACFLAALPSNAQEGTPDEVLRKQILGKWIEADSPCAVSVFEGDGAYRILAYESPKRSILIGQAKGTWWIKEGKLYTTIYETAPNLPPRDPEEVFEDRILEMSETTLWLMDKGGGKYSKERVKK